VSTSQQVECELYEVNSPENSNDVPASGPTEPSQSDVRISAIDTGDEQLYTEIENAATSPPDSAPPPPPVYQIGSCGYYQGLQVVPVDIEPPQRSLVQPISIYDKLSQRVLSGNNAETLVKRVNSLPIRRFPNTL